MAWPRTSGWSPRSRPNSPPPKRKASSPKNRRAGITSSIPRPLPLSDKGHLLPDFYSGATGLPGRFSSEGFALRRLQTGRPIIQGLRPTPAVPVIPAIKGCSGNPEFGQGLTDRQRRLLNQPDDLQLLGAGISHASSSPTPIALFFSRRFSSVSSATTSFSALASRRSSLTSSEVAARAVSPAKRFLPASRNSFDQR